jgi:ribosomal protein L39E
MSDDIVERLRVWSDNAKEQDANEIVVGLCQAADEIERLRKERDQARREVCEWVAMMTKRKPSTAAKDRGWDCFKEEQ